MLIFLLAIALPSAALIGIRTKANARTHAAGVPGGCAGTARPALPERVKVAAVQMLGYDKTEALRPGFDPGEAVVRYIERAARDGASGWSSSPSICWEGSRSPGRRRKRSPRRRRPSGSM